jgi:hypothetical protein
VGSFHFLLMIAIVCAFSNVAHNGNAETFRNFGNQCYPGELGQHPKFGKPCSTAAYFAEKFWVWKTLRTIQGESFSTMKNRN